MNIIEVLINWTNRHFAKFGGLGLFFLAFIEASFFPVPPDILLITLALGDPQNAIYYGVVCTVGSVLGGLFGYLIGYIGEKAVLEKMFKHDKIEKMHNYFEKYEAWAIFISGFTPVPYKLFTIGAGVFYVNIRKFIIFSFFGRGLRFMGEAILLMYFGKQIVEFLDSSFNVYTLVITLLLIGIFILYQTFIKKK